MSTLTVHCGSKALPVRDGEPPDLTLQQALLAPVAASAVLLTLYALIQYLSFDPSTVYRLSVCSLALVAVRDVAVQAVAAVARPETASSGEPLFRGSEQSIALVLSIALIGDYALGGGVMTSTAGGGLPLLVRLVENNAIAWCLALFSIGIVSLRTSRTAAVFLLGLFAYDIFWVFRSDVMMTVALKVDAPVKLLALNAPDGATPFAVLGLGDVAIPAFFCALMRAFDEARDAAGAARGTPPAPPSSYRRNAVLGYAVGLSAAFWANENWIRGQPALLYLVPACLGSALWTAWRRGELGELLAFEAPVTRTAIPLDLALLTREQRNPD